MEKDHITYDFCYTDENGNRTEIDGTYPVFDDESDLDRLENIIGKFMFVAGFPQFGKEYAFCRGVTGEEYEALDDYLKSLRNSSKPYIKSFEKLN